MADDHQERTTSVAKSLDGLAQQETALDRARALKEQFNHAAQNQHQQSQIEQVKSGEQQGSQTIKSDAPVLRPTPSGPLRDVDRQMAFAKIRKENEIEQQKLEAARRAEGAFKNRQQPTRDHEQDRDRDY